MNGQPDVSEVHNIDVVIIGAGISGVNAAYRIQTLTDDNYVILESRAIFGGTWDLFKYPGLRSDSDLYTLGFSWKPWTGGAVIAQKRLILNYMQEAIEENGIDGHIRYNHRVFSAAWSSKEQRWRITASVNSGGETKAVQYVCKFAVFGTGLYDYTQGKEATLPGITNFKGQVLHPQFWPEDANWDNKNVIIVGSGATAVTVLPVMAEKARLITMLQRSPGYIIPIMSVEGWFTKTLKWLLPIKTANTVIRWQWILLTYALFWFCRNYPMMIKNWMRSEMQKQLPSGYPMDPNFAPSYMPGDQRICFVPDADFYKAICQEKANVVTGTIKTVTEDGISLTSGEHLKADVIVTATGLKLLFGGHVGISIDGKPYAMGEQFLWKGTLLDGLPNAALIFGYSNASYTLGADASAHLICRVLNTIRSKRIAGVIPRLPKGTEFGKITPIIPLKSTYVKDATAVMPVSGDRGMWKHRTNYFADMILNKYGGVTKDLELIPLN